MLQVSAIGYEVHGLAKWTRYSFRIEAMGVNGPGLSSESVIVRTLSDVPSSAPINIVAEAISSDVNIALFIIFVTMTFVLIAHLLFAVDYCKMGATSDGASQRRNRWL